MAQPSREDVLNTRLEGLRRSLQLTDRVLSGKQDLTLSYERELNGHPAHTDYGKSIFINLSKVPEIGSKSSLVHLLGLNYHELAHVRYSNRQELGSSGHNRYWEAYAILEESRVETLMSARYAKLRKYFSYPVLHHFVNNRQAWNTAFLFLHGRRYMPRKVRDMFRSKFEVKYSVSVAEDFAKLIDEYRLLLIPEDRDRARNIIIEFAGLLEEHQLPVTKPEHGSDTGALSSSSRLSSSPSRSDQDQDSSDDRQQATAQTVKQDAREKLDEDADGSGFDGDDPEEEEGEEGEDESRDDSDSGGSEHQGADSTGSGGPEEEPGEEGESDGPGSGEDSQEEDSGDSENGGIGDQGDSDDPDQGAAGGGGNTGGDSDGLQEDDTATSGVGKGKSSSESRKPPTLRKMKQTILDILDMVLDDHQVQQDIRDLQDAMDGDAGLGSTLARVDGYNNLRPVTPRMIAESAAQAEVLRGLWAQMEPGWAYGVPDGSRLDMNRAALAQNAEDYESIYADWSEGQQDNAGTCIVFLLDRSSSMHDPLPDDDLWSNRITIACKHVWELMSAIQEIEAEATVLTYDTDCRTLYERGESVTTQGYVQLRPDGGTDPIPAIIEARRILTISEMRNKLLICVSDGDWGSPDPIVEVLDQIDAVKLAILIGNEKFRCSKAFDVTERSSGRIIEPMVKAVERILERNLER